MEWHDRGLAYAKDIERQQNGRGRPLDLAGQEAAFGEIQRAGDSPGPEDREQLQADLDRLMQANIPVDIVFNQGVAELGIEKRR